MQKLFKQKLKGFSGVINVISNWGDAELVTPDSSLRYNKLKEYGIQDKLVFQYAGNIGRAQGITTLIDSINMCKNEKIHFLFYGKGALLSYLKFFLPTNSIYGGNFSRDQLKEYLNACDISIISLQMGMKGLGVPSKTYNVLAAGKPILYIGEKESEIAILIKEHGIGYVCEPEPINIYNGIIWFQSQKKEVINEMSNKARKIFQQFYSKDIILNQYTKLFKQENYFSDRN